MKVNKTFCVSLITLVIVFFITCNIYGDDQVSNLVEQAILENGKVQLFTKDKQIAPMEIKTSEGFYYLIKMIEINSKETILTIFVHGGKVVNLNVPLDKYEVRYASGEKWYGYKDLFGPNTRYNKVEDIFDFKIEGNSVYGYTLILYNVQNGNLVTTPIDSEEF